jgi:hypothetical protein
MEGIVVAALVTGIEPVDCELKRREPFPSVEEAEELAARLLAIWRALQPGSSNIVLGRGRRTLRR